MNDEYIVQSRITRCLICDDTNHWAEWESLRETIYIEYAKKLYNDLIEKDEFLKKAKIVWPV